MEPWRPSLVGSYLAESQVEAWTDLYFCTYPASADPADALCMRTELRGYPTQVGAGWNSTDDEIE